jgi:hypothetical protein
MERAMVWFKCAAMHDSVRPVLKQPATIGWEAKQRVVDLTIERNLKGEELLQRMKGWFTVDVYQALEILNRYGKLKILDDSDLVVETKDMEELTSLSKNLEDVFGQEVWIEYLPKTVLL